MTDIINYPNTSSPIKPAPVYGALNFYFSGDDGYDAVLLTNNIKTQLACFEGVGESSSTSATTTPCTNPVDIVTNWEKNIK